MTIQKRIAILEAKYDAMTGKAPIREKAAVMAELKALYAKL